MTKTTDNTTYVSRPKGKPETSTKGKLNEWSNGYREFIPQGTRENNRQMLKQLGDSSFYMTQGKKESSYSLHVNVDGSRIVGIEVPFATTATGIHVSHPTSTTRLPLSPT